MAKLSHLSKDGRPQMVNVEQKEAGLRIATARSIVDLPQAVLSALVDGDGLSSSKGNVFQTAVLAGIMAAKKTGELIPLCHPIGLDHCHIEIYFDDLQRVVIDCTARVVAKTGVEMEAMVGASMAALTIYDMCKAVSHDIVILETKLMSKSGGKRDFNRTS